MRHTRCRSVTCVRLRRKFPLIARASRLCGTRQPCVTYGTTMKCARSITPKRRPRSLKRPAQPATRVHVDHTANSGPQRVRDLLGDEAEELLRGRVQVINLWRPIRGPLRDAPLAVCDARSVSPNDLVPSDLVYRNRVGETYAVTYNPSHRWFYVPAMRTDEALLIKCFDSLTDGRARFVPHTAFIDPTAPAELLPRESIEIRSLVFHSS